MCIAGSRRALKRCRAQRNARRNHSSATRLPPVQAPASARSRSVGPSGQDLLYVRAHPLGYLVINEFRGSLPIRPKLSTGRPHEAPTMGPGHVPGRRAQRNARRNLWLGSESADASTCSLKAPIRRPLRAGRNVPQRRSARPAAYPRVSKLVTRSQARCPRVIHRTLSGRTSTLLSAGSDSVGLQEPAGAADGQPLGIDLELGRADPPAALAQPLELRAVRRQPPGPGRSRRTSISATIADPDEPGGGARRLPWQSAGRRPRAHGPGPSRRRAAGPPPPSLSPRSRGSPARPPTDGGSAGRPASSAPGGPAGRPDRPRAAGAWLIDPSRVETARQRRPRVPSAHRPGQPGSRRPATSSPPPAGTSSGVGRLLELGPAAAAHRLELAGQRRGDPAADPDGRPAVLELDRAALADPGDQLAGRVRDLEVDRDAQRADQRAEGQAQRVEAVARSSR